MPVTRRLARKIQQIFPVDAQDVISLLHKAEGESLDGDAGERVLTAAIIYSRGDIDRLLAAVEEMETDWRDLLVMAGLESEDSESKLDEFLGSMTE